MTTDPRAAIEAQDEVLAALGDLVAGLHVPRSMGSIMVPSAYDRLRDLIGDRGWSSGGEVTTRLRAALLDAASAPGLDVERLAEAIWVWYHEAEEGPYEHASAAHRASVRDFARGITATYAALAPSQPEPGL